MRKVFLDALPRYKGHGVDWEQCIGKSINFIYDDIKDTLYVKDYIDKKHHKLLVEYHNISFVVKTDTIARCMLQNIIHNIYVVDSDEKLIKYIVDDHDKIKNLTIASERYVNVQCPNCYSIRKIQVKQLFQTKTISCKKCSDGKSYPEKFIYSMLEQLNINYICEFPFKDNDKLVLYDFYLNDINLIIEVDGKQHYDRRNKWFNEYNDKYKEELLKKNNIKLIRINAYQSDLNYIKKSVENSELKNIFNLSDIDWNLCHSDACKSLIYEAGYKYQSGINDLNELSSLLHISRKTLREYLIKANQIGICNFSIFELNKLRYKKCIENSKKKCNKRVSVYKDNILIGTFESVTYLCNHSYDLFGVIFDNRHVGDVANGKYGRKTHHGFSFKWE